MNTSRILQKWRGFSLVEVMVGLVIGMVGLIVMLQVYAVSESQNRTTTSGNDAQQNGLIALIAIERDVRQAGYGFTSFPGATSNPAMGCTTLAYNETLPSPSTLSFRLVPILITDGGGGVSDTIRVTYGTATDLAVPVAFTQPSGSAANYAVEKKMGFNVGDFVLAVEPGQDCTLVQVTGLAAASDVIIHNPGRESIYNSPGGLGVTYCTGGPCLTSKLLNLGQVTLFDYAVNADNLTLTAFLVAAGAGIPVTLAENIVNIQAQYGVDTNNDSQVDAWRDATGGFANSATTPTADDLMRIKAARIGVVARSALPEKADPVAGCNITPAAPSVWIGGPAVDLSATPNWACYRYKVYQTIIPIRNMIWSE